MRLPDHLEIVENENGERVFGHGPYTIFLRDKRTDTLHHIVLPAMDLFDSKNPVQRIMEELEKALKEQLNENHQR